MALEFTTERLLVRPALPSDAAALAARRSDPAVARYQDWPAPYSIGRATALLEDASAADTPVADEWFMFTVIDGSSGDIYGELALLLGHNGRSAEIGYSLASAHWGNGYAVEAVRPLVRYLFDEIGVTRIQGLLHPDNVASALVLERTGFLWEGHTRLSYWEGDENSDDWIYGITRRDWESWTARPTETPQQLRLVEVTPQNVRTVRALVTHRSQQRLVAPVVNSLADALVPEVIDGAPVTPWYRAIEADNTIVGFVMLTVPSPSHPEPYLWRLLVDRLHQRRGIGRIAVQQVIEVCRGLGASSLAVSWEEGRGSPRPFYERLGFETTGRIIDGEVEARLLLG